MSLSTVTALLSVAAAEGEAHSEPAVSPWVIGGITFVILMGLLAGVIAFGGGREHT